MTFSYNMDRTGHCDLAVCCQLATNWFLSPCIDFVYGICDKIDKDHIRKRISLERAGFEEVPQRPSKDEITVVRLMVQ